MSGLQSGLQPVEGAPNARVYHGLRGTYHFRHVHDTTPPFDQSVEVEFPDGGPSFSLMIGYSESGDPESDPFADAFYSALRFDAGIWDGEPDMVVPDEVDPKLGWVVRRPQARDN